MVNRCGLGLRCGICGNYNHFEMRCPQVRMYINHDFFLYKHLVSIENKRSGNALRKRKKFRAFKDFQVIRTVLRDFKKELILELMEDKNLAQDLIQNLEAESLVESRSISSSSSDVSGEGSSHRKRSSSNSSSSSSSDSSNSNSNSSQE